ncbi:MAG: hypothetical protein LBN06_05585 [Prevotellaceae bacterium]|jgi:hypothetical protein|nr:hypothetical protein [Prevotellaceae bacterium]
MKSKIYILLSTLTLAGMFSSCLDKDDSYTVAPPSIVSVTPDKTSFVYGDTLRLTATLTDPAARLTSLAINILAGDRLIGTQVTPLVNQSEEGIVIPVVIPFVSQAQAGDLTLNLTLTNVLKGATTAQVSGLTASRPTFDKLYLVTHDGQLFTLASTGSNTYSAQGLEVMQSVLFGKIAQRLTPDNQPDYTGFVFGDQDGRIATVGESGKNIYIPAVGDDYIKSISFNDLTFTATATGEPLTDSDLALSRWEATTLGNEPFLTFTTRLTRGETLTLFGDLKDPQLIFNVDFFDRSDDGRTVTFLRETGNYTLYYNTQRGNVLILPADAPAAYPDYLLMTGGGVGAPSQFSDDKATCWWGFGNVRDYMIAPRVADGVYQLTMWIHAKDDSWVSFKLYSDSDWGGDWGGSAFTFTGDKAYLADGGNIVPTDNVSPDKYYRLLIDMNNKTISTQEYP